MTYDEMINLLPELLKEEGNATNFKKIIEAYANLCEYVDKKISDSNRLLDVYYCTGEMLDNLGLMFYVVRLDGEDDEDFRTRILEAINKRNTPTTLPEIQEAVDSIVSSGKLYVLPNYNNEPCNIYVTGTADDLDISRAMQIIPNLVAAGIETIVPIYSFGSWENVKNQFSTWESLSQENYIW